MQRAQSKSTGLKDRILFFFLTQCEGGKLRIADLSAYTAALLKTARVPI